MKLTRFSSLHHILKNMAPYYAVAKGRNPGIYSTWDQCKAQVHQFSGPVYKKFNSQEEAEDFIKLHKNFSTKAKSTNTIPTVRKRKSQAQESSNDDAKPVSKRRAILLDFVNKSTEKDIKSRKYIATIDQKIVNTVEYRTGGNPIFNVTNADTIAICVPGIVQQLVEAIRVSFVEGQWLGFSSDKFLVIQAKNFFTMSDFNTDSDGYVNVYTDGACSSNGRSNSQAGIGVWFGDNHPLNVSEPVVGRATNNNAEIQAVTAAARQARLAGVEKLRINTDSEFLIKCAENWMPRWKSNGWKTADNKPVINRSELQEMERATSSLDVTYNHVRGHSGIRGNEMADRLARAGCSQYSKKY